MPRIVFWQAKLPGVESWSTHKCRWIPCMVLAWSSAFSCPVPSISQHLSAPPSCIDCFLPGICRWHRQRWFVLVVEWITWWGRQISCIGNWEVPAGRLKQRWHDDWPVVSTCLDMFQIFSSFYIFSILHPAPINIIKLLTITMIHHDPLPGVVVPIDGLRIEIKPKAKACHRRQSTCDCMRHRAQWMR